MSGRCNYWGTVQSRPWGSLPAFRQHVAEIQSPTLLVAFGTGRRAGISEIGRPFLQQWMLRRCSSLFWQPNVSGGLSRALLRAGDGKPFQHAGRESTSN